MYANLGLDPWVPGSPEYSIPI